VPLYRAYGTRRKALKTEHLNFYNLTADPETREVLLADCQILKALYDCFESDYRVRASDIPILSTKTKNDKHSVESSLDRLERLSDSIHAPFVKVLPFLASQFKGELRLGSKRFFIETASEF